MANKPFERKSIHKSIRNNVEGSPKAVAIIGMGPSSDSFLKYMQKHDVCHDFPDEIWAINYAADWVKADRVFFLDGIQKNMSDNEWAKWYTDRNPDVPIYGPRWERQYETIVRYPIEWVHAMTGETWFGNSVAYAMAFACALSRPCGGRLERVDMWGCDFDYKKRVDEILKGGSEDEKKDKYLLEQDAREFVYDIETGHATCAYWAGLFRVFGIVSRVSTDSTFLSMKDRRFYGFTDEEQPDIEAGKVSITKGSGISTKESTAVQQQKGEE
jgi:hypothetical protein